MKRISVGLVALVLTVGATSWGGLSAADGDSDTSFGGDGIVTTAIAEGLAFDSAAAVTVQDNGRIVVAGRADMGATGFDVAVARYLSSGELDTSFGGDGIVTFFPDIYPGSITLPAETDAAESVLMQPDGKIVVAGQLYMGSDLDDVAVVRFLSDGSPDLSFGLDGYTKVAVAPGERADVGRAAVLQPDGRIVVVGTADMDTSGDDIAVVRFDPNGDPDLTFGDAGVLTLPFTGDEEGLGVALAPNGNIVVVGSTDQTPANGRDSLVMRLRPDGSMDDTFGLNGVVTTSAFGGDTFDQATDVAIDRAGRIVVTGTSETFPLSGDTEIVVARYLTTGVLDTDFGGDGIVTVGFGNRQRPEQAESVEIQSDGRIVVAGRRYSGLRTRSDGVVVRMMPNGDLDETFGDRGRVTIPIGPSDASDFLFGLAIQPNGRIVAVGDTDTKSSTGTDMALVRLEAVPQLRVGATRTAAAAIRERIPVGSTVEVQVKARFRDVCRATGTSIRAVAPGTCRARIILTTPDTPLTGGVLRRISIVLRVVR